MKKPPVKPDNLRSFDVYVDDEYFRVEVNDLYKPNPELFNFYSSVSANPDQTAASLSSPQAMGNKSSIQAREGEIAVTAPLPGTVVRYDKKVGDSVKVGERIAIIEAMKMNNNIDSTCDGEITQIPFKTGSNLAKGDIICTIKISE